MIEMKSNDGEILKKDIDWLWEAISIHDRQIIGIFDDSAIATDGMRLHAINIEKLPDEVHGLTREDIIEKSAKLGPVKASFLINPEFLTQALSAFVSPTKIELVGDDDFLGVRITDGSDRMAFIAGMKKENESEEDD
jgi:hypothetical protein